MARDFKLLKYSGDVGLYQLPQKLISAKTSKLLFVYGSKIIPLFLFDDSQQENN